MLSEDFVDSDNFSTNQLVLRKRNCKMSSKLMLRHCENMKRTKKLRQPPTLTACQNSTKTTLIFSIFLIIFAVSGKQTFLNQALYSKFYDTLNFFGICSISNKWYFTLTIYYLILLRYMRQILTYSMLYSVNQRSIKYKAFYTPCHSNFCLH